MKKVMYTLLIIILILLVTYGMKKDIEKVKKTKDETAIEEHEESNITINKNTVTYNGWLSVNGTKLLNDKNEEIQLRGISTHGIQWYGELYNIDNIRNIKDTWGTNVFRIAMYTDPKSNGYIKNKSLKEDLIKIVDEVISLDMYVIIDWHILEDGNPTKWEKESLEFFDEMSKRYKDTPNVIFEICNEPNGDVKWERDVLPYASKVIEVIRNNSPKSLIIVGIPGWCKDLASVSNKPLAYDNIMYSVHFYAGSDGPELRAKMNTFLEKGFPIFISECGITDNTGNGAIYKDKFREWVNYLNEKNISWIFWSFSNKNENSSILIEDYKPAKYSLEYGTFNLPHLKLTGDLNDYLTESGKVLKEIFEDYKKNSF